MGTRCGDIDPAIIAYLMKKTGMDLAGIDNVLNKQSGLLGISGVSSDMRYVEQAANEGNIRAKQALDVWQRKLVRYIGACAAEMNGVDAIVFTAGIGENDAAEREEVCAHLSYLGIEIDKEANNMRGQERLISTPDSKVKVYVIPTDEELMIARDTAALAAK